MMDKKELQVIKGKLGNCSYITRELTEYLNELTNSYIDEDDNIMVKFALERAIQKIEDLYDILDSLNDIIIDEIYKIDKEMEDKPNEN